MARLLAIVRAAAAAWVIAAFTVMTVAVWVQVGGRYIFNYSIASSAEIATLAQIWMVLVGAGVACRQDLHARIDALVKLFPTPIRRVLMATASLLGLVFLGAVVKGALPLIEQGHFQTTPALGLPMWIPYLGLVIGPVYFAIELVALVVRQWQANVRPAEVDAT